MDTLDFGHRIKFYPTDEQGNRSADPILGFVTGDAGGEGATNPLATDPVPAAADGLYELF